jgi:hypothetical protein
MNTQTHAPTIQHEGALAIHITSNTALTGATCDIDCGRQLVVAHVAG